MLGDRIRKRRIELDMTQEELAIKTGYKTKGAISRIESGTRDISQSQISIFAKALNTTESNLMGWGQDIDYIIDKHPDLHPIRKIKNVPILGTIACGTPIWADQNFEGYFGLDESHMNGDFILRCSGDSMEDAEIYDGDLVFLKKTPDVENGAIAAVLIDNEATLKKVYKQEEQLILQPCNSSYEPIVFKYEDLKDKGILILGECVGVYHPR